MSKEEIILNGFTFKSFRKSRMGDHVYFEIYKRDDEPLNESDLKYLKCLLEQIRLYEHTVKIEKGVETHAIGSISNPVPSVNRDKQELDTEKIKDKLRSINKGHKSKEQRKKI